MLGAVVGPDPQRLADVDALADVQEEQAETEQSEAVNSLLLGICLRLARFPERIEIPPASGPSTTGRAWSWRRW